MKRRKLIRYVLVGGSVSLAGCTQLEELNDWFRSPPPSEWTNDLQVANHNGKPHTISVEIIDESGVIVFEDSFHLDSGEEVNISSFAPAGNYLVTAQTENGDQSQRSLSTECEVTEFQIWIVSGGEIEINQTHCD
nr:T9SS type A sorting domain-containing protein [Haloferax larsenii]